MKGLAALSPRDRFVLTGISLVLAACLVLRPVLFLILFALLLVTGQRQIARLFPSTAAASSAGLAYGDLLLRAAPWLLVAAGSAWMVHAAHLPLDDLLRHILAKGWKYDYASHYGHHIVDQHWSYWVGFDWAVGAIHAATGDILTTSRMVRAIIFAGVGSAVVLAVNRTHPDPVVRVAATAAILFGFLWLRLNLGRPEVVFTGLLIAALALPRLVWLACFVLLSPAYWLAPLYAIGALLLGGADEPWKARLARNIGVALAGLMVHAAFWWHYSEGGVLHTLDLLRQIVDNHAEAKRPVGELMPLVDGTSNPMVLALMGLLLAAVWTYRDVIEGRARFTIIAILAVSGYFGLPDYARYGSLIWSLLLLAALAVASGYRTPAGARPWVLVAVATLALLGMRPISVDASDKVLEHLAVPAGSRVLTSFNPSTYLAAAANPQSVITPIFDINSTVPPYRQLVMELSLGRLDCAQLLSLDAFDFVIESTLQGEAPACLQLLRVDGKHRLWAVGQRAAS